MYSALFLREIRRKFHWLHEGMHKTWQAAAKPTPKAVVDSVSIRFESIFLNQIAPQISTVSIGPTEANWGRKADRDQFEGAQGGAEGAADPTGNISFWGHQDPKGWWFCLPRFISFGSTSGWISWSLKALHSHSARHNRDIRDVLCARQLPSFNA